MPKDRQPPTPEELQQLEIEMHERFRPWGLSHEDKDGSGIKYLGYDPEAYPEQRIEEFVTEARLPARVDKWLPERLIMMGLREKLLAKALGSSALASALVEDFKATPAYTGQGSAPSIATEISSLAEQGKNIAMAFAHKEYADVGIGIGGLSVAMGKTRHITEHNWQTINKLMTTESYNGKPITSFTRATGKILWGIPPGARQKWGIPAKVWTTVNGGSARAFNPALDNPDQGVIWAVAPTASGMLRKEKDGEEAGWEFPDIHYTTTGMLDKIDAVAPFAYSKNYETGEPAWSIGQLILPPDEETRLCDTDKNKLYLDNVMVDLGQRMERLIGEPVEYRRILAADAAGQIAVKRSTSP